jgi:hypothetical protein
MDLHAATELLQATAAAVTAGRLAYLGLGRRFPGVIAYLAFLAISDLAFGVLDQSSHLYFFVYVASTALESICNIFAVRELLTVTFASYPGIRTVGRWAMYLGIGVAAIVSVLITKYLWATGRATVLPKLVVFYNEVAARSISLTLAVVVVTVIFVLSKYPLHLPRNIYISFAFFSALFLSDAARLFIDGLAPALSNNYADWSEAILSALLLASWAALLRAEEPSGAAQAVRIAFSTPEEEHLLQQLKSLNNLMSRAGRQ